MRFSVISNFYAVFVDFVFQHFDRCLTPYKLRTVLNSTRDEKVETNRIEEILVSNSSPVSGLSEASGVKFSWVEVSRESLTN